MKIRFWTSAIVLTVLTAALCSCHSNSAASQEVKLQGAGATFPAPLYTKWFKAYCADHPDMQVDYQAIGSGGGKKNVIDKTVDFGASDAAMTDEEMARVQGGVQLLPMTAGAIVIAYNLDGVTNLNLPRAVYPEIFLGKITRWNDPAIVAANPGVKLPDLPINVIVRSDGSGTSYVFSKHLSTIDPAFDKAVGANTMPNWPVGTKSKGNEGVTAGLKSTPGSIGYVEYGYAKLQNLTFANLQNKSGKYVAASTASGQAALASVDLPSNLIGWASDPSAADAYPIVTYTWMIFYKKYDDPKKVAAIQDLVKYCLNNGQQTSESMGYIPLPASVVSKDLAAIQTIS
ncbi:MAG: phosphate ABC transporter substrate-binding protein PstS [Candidatus Korobacteraceae bacterium]